MSYSNNKAIHTVMKEGGKLQGVQVGGGQHQLLLFLFYFFFTLMSLAVSINLIYSSVSIHADVNSFRDITTVCLNNYRCLENEVRTVIRGTSIM